MNVAVFVEYFPPKLGSDRRIFEIMKRLSQKHEIHFIVFPPMRMLLKGMQKNEGVDKLHLQKITSTEKHAKITGHFIQISARIAKIWQYSFPLAFLLTSVWVLKEAAKVFGRMKPDVIVLNYPSPYTGLLGLTLGRLWRKPVVLDFNDLIAQYAIELLNIKKNGFMAKLIVLIQEFIARNSRKVTVPTRFIRNYAASLGVPERNLVTIPNGVDTSEFDPNRYASVRTDAKLGNHNRKTCHYYGRLDAWAGLNIISKLCDRAREKGLNVKFVLTGSGASKEFCKENAIFLGETPHEKIPLLLADADIVLIPFPRNEVSNAASPLKLFEGMAMQKPVIASRVSGVEDVISDGENGFLADPDNIDEWVEKLETILASEALAAKVGQNARRTVEVRYDWTFLANQFDQVLNAVISNSGGLRETN